MVTAGPVVPTTHDRLALAPVVGGRCSVTGGLWAARQRLNREVTVPYGMKMLEETGTLENLRVAAGTSSAPYRQPRFRDSDLYKVLEAICWERAHGPDGTQEAFLAAAAELLAAARDPDGYLNSYVQVEGRRFADPAMGHELYCAGHLIQAAVADLRTSGGTTSPLAEVAIRFAAMLQGALTGEQKGFVPGHPEIETALVELYRTNGDRSLLELASDLLGRRGRSSLSWHGLGASYFQDEVPFEQATTIRGHAVRALYLLAGAADLYTETGRPGLLPPLLAQWQDMVSAKTYLTGGLGSRHKDEAFGDPYELPPDRAYCETCAAIASIMWNWRLLLLTGEARFAELMERTLYNGFLAGIGLDGTSFFYDNPLQVRVPRARPPWYDCACCPPNVMRLLASLDHYLATVTDRGLQVHQHVSSRLRTPGGPGEALEVEIDSGLPFAGTVAVRVLAAPAAARELAFRVPRWAGEVEVGLNGRSLAVEPGADRYLRVEREWRPGDELDLELPLRARVVRASGEVDGARGCVAYERGPLVYCLEGIDVPGGRGLRGISVDPRKVPDEEPGVDVAGERVVALRLAGQRSGALAVPGEAGWPYFDGAGSSEAIGTPPEAVELRAVPYYAWANRGPSDLRVWVPEAG